MYQYLDSTLAATQNDTVLLLLLKFLNRVPLLYFLVNRLQSSRKQASQNKR